MYVCMYVCMSCLLRKQGLCAKALKNSFPRTAIVKMCNLLTPWYKLSLETY